MTSPTPRETPREQIRSERQRFVARVFLGVCLSILLHVVISVATYEASGWFEETRPRKSTLIEWIEPSQLKNDHWTNRSDQVVRKAELPPELLDLNVKPTRRFLSEEKQTVKKETRAAATGLTENRTEKLDLSPSRPAPKWAPAAESNQQLSSAQKASSTRRDRLPEIVPNSIFEEGIGDIAVERKPTTSGSRSRNLSRELILPTDPRRNRGISTTGEQLPKDIQIGDFTALNTDRFLYYTFYARIEEQIRHRWVRFVKAAMYGGGDFIEGQSEYMTNLEIVLNREGEYVRAIVHEPSGSRDVDAAPILAFREARRIPHPPREMVKEDGTIRLFYSFHVDQIPPMARVKSPERAKGSAAASDADLE